MVSFLSKYTCFFSDITSLNNRVAPMEYNDFGDAVELNNTSWSTKYSTNWDGIVYVANTAGQDGIAYIQGINGSNTKTVAIGGTSGYFSCFVRRGCKLFATGTYSSIVFYPFKKA